MATPSSAGQMGRRPGAAARLMAWFHCERDQIEQLSQERLDVDKRQTVGEACRELGADFVRSLQRTPPGVANRADVDFNRFDG